MNYSNIIQNNINTDNKLVNDLKNKIKQYENEINNLKLKEADYKQKIIKYEEKISKLKKDNFDLRNKMNSFQNNINNNSNDNNENKDKIIISLTEELKIKNKEIRELKEIKEINKSYNLKEAEKLIPIIFISVDQKIHYAFICKNTDKFHMVETLLYDIYPEYLESENYFTVKGNKINRYKTMDQNNIKYSDIIILNKYD